MGGACVFKFLALLLLKIFNKTTKLLRVHCALNLTAAAPKLNEMCLIEIF